MRAEDYLLFQALRQGLQGRCAMKLIASKCRVGILLRPRLPAGTLAGDILKADAIDRAHRHAQLAARAIGLNDGVHHLVAAQNGVGRAGLDAQRAAYAPGFVNDGNGAWALKAIGRVQGLYGQACDGCQPLYAFSAARRALVDGRTANGNGLCVGCAVGVAATRALRLRQRSVDAFSEQVQVWGQVWRGHPAIVRQPDASFAARCFGRCFFTNGLGKSLDQRFSFHLGYRFGDCNRGICRDLSRL